MSRSQSELTVTVAMLNETLAELGIAERYQLQHRKGGNYYLFPCLPNETGTYSQVRDLRGGTMRDAIAAMYRDAFYTVTNELRKAQEESTAQSKPRKPRKINPSKKFALQILEWHNGQFSPSYSLGSTMLALYDNSVKGLTINQSMIDACALEFENALESGKLDGKEYADLLKLANRVKRLKTVNA